MGLLLIIQWRSLTQFSLDQWGFDFVIADFCSWRLRDVIGGGAGSGRRHWWWRHFRFSSTKRRLICHWSYDKRRLDFDKFPGVNLPFILSMSVCLSLFPWICLSFLGFFHHSIWIQSVRIHSQETRNWEFLFFIFFFQIPHFFSSCFLSSLPTSISFPSIISCVHAPHD